MAQWLERRSLAGGVVLIYSWHATTSSLNCSLCVNQPSQLSLPFLRGR